MPAIRIVASVLALVVATACDDSPNDGGLSAKFFEQAKASRPAGRMSLSAIGPNDWDKVCYYGPYLQDPKLKIDNSDGQWTLVFFKADVEAARIQGMDRKLILRPKEGFGDSPCIARAEAAISWAGETAHIGKP